MWHDPKTLGELERQVRSGEVAPDPGNDFGSYKLLNSGSSPDVSRIWSHNLPLERARFKARSYKRLVGGISVGAILDVGCGAGFTAEALRQVFPGATVHGVDVSSDAVSYAQAQFPACTFIARTLDPDDAGVPSEVAGSETLKFDLILAQEFYPFTRTADYDYHKRWLDLLLRETSTGGCVVIQVAYRTKESVNANVSRLVQDYAAQAFVIPNDRISRSLPGFLGRALGGVMEKTYPKGMQSVLVIRRTDC